MPELPEVEGLRAFLETRLVGRCIARVDLANFSALKTVALPPTALYGLELESVGRRGKFVAVSASDVHLVFHLARAGWLVWHETAPAQPARPGKSPVALRVVLDDGAAFDLTEAGTQRKLAVYVVSRLEDVPGIATLGPDPLADGFGPAQLAEILEAAGRAQLKGVLRDQRVLAGIGNAYSDEILHAARLSPFKPANSLTPAEQATLLECLRHELGSAIGRAVGLKPSQLKDDKRTHMRVHARAGQACDVCGGTIAEVSFADSALQYCPGCQTGGKPLADRRLSKLLK